MLELSNVVHQHGHVLAVELGLELRLKFLPSLIRADLSKVVQNGLTSSRNLLLQLLQVVVVLVDSTDVEASSGKLHSVGFTDSISGTSDDSPSFLSLLSISSLQVVAWPQEVFPDSVGYVLTSLEDLPGADSGTAVQSTLLGFVGELEFVENVGGELFDVGKHVNND